MPFLSSADQTTLPTAVPARTVQEESSMAMDPQVILESSAVYLNGEVGVETSAALVEARPM